jgi:hypothetical protein
MPIQALINFCNKLLAKVIHYTTRLAIVVWVIVKALCYSQPALPVSNVYHHYLNLKE